MDSEMQICNELSTISYASVLKNSLSRKRYNSECEQMTWYDQVEKFERDESKKHRSASCSNMTDYGIGSPHTEPQTSSSSSIESLNQKMSSDSDSCIDTMDTMDTSSEEKFDKLFIENRQKLGYKRRSSVDSHHTTSSSGCSLFTDAKSRTESSSSDEIFETDEAVLVRRQKQIDYGKQTIGYKQYVQQISSMNRQKTDPRTPNKHIKYSRRAFDGMIRSWRKQLHLFDPIDTNTNTKTTDKQSSTKKIKYYLK